MALPGILFMVKNEETVNNAVGEAKFTLNAQGLKLASYYLFLLGMTLFTLGMYSVGLAVELPIPLAACAAVSGPISVLIFMGIAKTSITGIPGIAGPPLPPRIALVIVALILNGNAIAVFMDGTAVAWSTFFAVYVAAVGVPHAVGFKHRSAYTMV